MLIIILVFVDLKIDVASNAFPHSGNCSLLTPSLLELYSTAPFIPAIIDGLALYQHIVDGSLYLGHLVISFLSLLLFTIRRSPV